MATVPSPRPDLLEAAAAYVRQVQAALQGLPLGPVAILLDHLIAARQAGRTVFIFGNGGSSSTASHMAGDLGKGTIVAGHPRVRALSLTDNVPAFSAWANDTEYARVFAEQLQALARPGDIAIAISASGNSPNVIQGIEAARSLGLFTAAFLGFGGGKAERLVDLAIVVPSGEYGPVEDVHLILNHLVTTVLRDVARSGPPDGTAAGQPE